MVPSKKERRGITPEQLRRAEAQLKDELMRVRDYVKDRPNLKVRVYVDYAVINRKVVRSDGQSWFISSGSFSNPWTSDHEEFMKWRFEDGYLIVKEERFGTEDNQIKRYWLMKASRVRLIQVVEPERTLQETTIPRVK